MEEALSFESIMAEMEEANSTEVKIALSSGQRAPAGKYLCTCIDSSPRRVNTREYSAYVANLKFRIDRVFEIEGKTVDPDDWSSLENKHIWDDVFLPRDEEKPALRNRRLLVAHHLGILKDGKLTPRSWEKDVLGKRVILTLVNSKYVKDGETKETVKVDFGGYEAVENAENTVGDSLDDI